MTCRKCRHYEASFFSVPAEGNRWDVLDAECEVFATVNGEETATFLVERLNGWLGHQDGLLLCCSKECTPRAGFGNSVVWTTP